MSEYLYRWTGKSGNTGYVSLNTPFPTKVMEELGLELAGPWWRVWLYLTVPRFSWLGLVAVTVVAAGIRIALGDL